MSLEIQNRGPHVSGLGETPAFLPKESEAEILTGFGKPNTIVLRKERGNDMTPNSILLCGQTVSWISHQQRASPCRGWELMTRATTGQYAEGGGGGTFEYSILSGMSPSNPSLRGSGNSV